MTIEDFASELKERLNPYTGNDGVGFDYWKMCKVIDDIIEREHNTDNEKSLYTLVDWNDSTNCYCVSAIDYENANTVLEKFLGSEEYLYTSWTVYELKNENGVIEYNT